MRPTGPPCVARSPPALPREGDSSSPPTRSASSGPAGSTWGGPAASSSSGARIDAEALTRARAMGVRGIVVATLPGEDCTTSRPPSAASGPRSTPPRRSASWPSTGRSGDRSPVGDHLLERLAGPEGALLVEPPSLVFEADPTSCRSLPPDWVRIRSGVHAGLEGRVIAMIGPRRFAANVLLEAARVAVEDGHHWTSRSVTWSASSDRSPAKAVGPRPRRGARGSATLGAMSTPLAAERVVTTLDAAETRSLAARLAAAARPGDLLCLVGELGAGKTQFAKGFAVGLGVSDTVTSPTFVLMTEYVGRLPLFHLDLYRLDDAADALAGGLLDERQLEGVALVEWAERLGPALPSSAWTS